MKRMARSQKNWMRKYIHTIENESETNNPGIYFNALAYGKCSDSCQQNDK